MSDIDKWRLGGLDLKALLNELSDEDLVKLVDACLTEFQQRIRTSAGPQSWK